jgi:hypothetical protein
MDLENRTDAKVVQAHPNPTRAFEVFDFPSMESVGVVLVGDPIKPPRHYTHDLAAVRRWSNRYAKGYR